MGLLNSKLILYDFFHVLVLIFFLLIILVRELDAFKFIHGFQHSISDMNIKPSKQEEAPAHAYVSSFFDAVVDTLKSMEA